MVSLKKMFKNIWYIFELSYSFSKYYFFSIFFKIEDYIDYLEIVRFQLWHSSIANETSLASNLKLKKKNMESKFGLLVQFLLKLEIGLNHFRILVGLPGTSAMMLIIWNLGWSRPNIFFILNEIRIG